MKMKLRGSKILSKNVSFEVGKGYWWRHTTIREGEKALEKTSSRLGKEIDKQTSEPGNVDLVEKLNDLKSESEKIIELRTKGPILRSKIRWYNEGEKNTKYFLNLEKRHWKEGTISQLKQNANNFVTSDQEILAKCQSFYMNLYAAKVQARRKCTRTFVNRPIWLLQA